MRVLFTTAWYPNRKVAGDGVFVQKHARAVAQCHDVVVLMVQTDVSVRGCCVEIEPSIHASDKGASLSEVLVYVPKIRFEIPVLTALLRLFWLSAGFLRGYSYIKKHCWQGQRPEVCHVNVLTRAAVLPWLLKKLHRIPYIITEHWSRYHRQGAFPANKLHLWLTRRVVADADYVCPVSLNLEQAMKQWGLQNKHYVRVGNVVDTKIFAQQPASSSVDSSFFVNSDNPVNLLHVSWMRDDVKNISGILRVMSRLKAEGASFHLRLVGEGNDKPALIKQASQLGLLPDHVSFVGAKEGEALAEEYQRSDALLMFSNVENQPVSVLEALSCGLPVIATAVGSLPAMLASNRGIVVDAGDEQQLYEVLQAFISLCRTQRNDKELREARHKYVENHHSAEVIARQFSVLYPV